MSCWWLFVVLSTPMHAQLARYAEVCVPGIFLSECESLGSAAPFEHCCPSDEESSDTVSGSFE